MFILVSQLRIQQTKTSEFTNFDQNNYKSKNNLFCKSDNTQLLSPLMNENNLQKTENATITNSSSTLSLHIAAYENSVENDNASKQENHGEGATELQKNTKMKWKESKQIVGSSAGVLRHFILTIINVINISAINRNSKATKRS